MKALKQTGWIHLILWGLYVISEFLANMIHYRPWQREQLVRDIVIYLPVIMAASYTISLWLVPRFLQTGQKLKFWLGVMAILILLYLGRIYWVAMLSYLERGEWTVYPASKVLKNVIRDYAVVGFAVCLQIIADWQRQAKINQQLKSSQAELALKLLKAQLHPHFLFNTLNNLYGLALRKSDETPDGILQLSALLDYLLYAAEKDYVSLKQEVELLDNYIALEKLRYGTDLVVDWQVVEPLDRFRLAPLLLLPLAENAFKHGHKGLDGRLHLSFELVIEDNCLTLNFGNSVQASISKSNNQGGIGLQNLRQRLALLYPDRHKLQIEAREDWFEARLWICLT